MKISELAICVASDVYEAGRTDDGQSYTAELFYVMAEDGDGNRWRHAVDFHGCNISYDSEGLPHFEDVRANANIRAATLLNKLIVDGGKLDMMRWNAIRPVYGSSAYQQYGSYDDWIVEQREESI
jgi:hypothetical protein